MATTVLPFEDTKRTEVQDIRPEDSEIYPLLSAEFQSVVQENQHLLAYLHILPIDDMGIPSYASKPSRKLGDDKAPNYIYPTNNAGVFVHVAHNPEGIRNSYIPVEPCLIKDYTWLVRQVESKLLDIRADLLVTNGDADRKTQLVRWVDRVTVTGTRRKSEKTGLLQFLRKGAINVRPLRVTPQELWGIKYMYLRDKYGLGPLEPLISDPYIEDISCSGLGHIFIEHKIFKSLRSAVVFSELEELDEFVLWLAERIRKPISFTKPISDATLPDGSRINIVFGKAVSKRGSNFSIRKFAGTPTSIFELIDFGSLNYQILAYLSLVIGNGLNVFVSGETASGKTTLLNAITTFMHPLSKVVSIEDTPELQVPHKNWVREVVQSTRTDENATGVNMFDLLRAGLRQRPNYIIVGEIRGAEGNVAFQAMQTGHAVMATFHAATVEKLIQRMTGAPISVSKTYIDNLNVVILTSAVKLPNGKMGRRLTGINEIVSYDSALDSFTFIEVFHWNEATDTFEFPGYMTSDMLENKISPRLGFTGKNKQRIYSELGRRAKILERLHREQGITDFYQLLDVLSKAQREGYF